MGSDGIHLSKIEKIKRSKTMVTEKKSVDQEALLSAGNAEAGIPGKQKKEKVPKEKEKNAGNRISELKNASGSMPVLKPKNKPGKSLSKRQLHELEEKERQEATRELENVQALLEQEENRVFGKDVGNVRRVKYASLRTGAKKKRVDSAVKRRKNAAMILEIEKNMKVMAPEIEDVDKETFIKNLKAFLKLSGDPYKMDTDEDFVENLEKNYALCETAEKMQKWVDDAVEGGYFPAKTDLAEVQAKILRYRDMKEYLDTQSELMKNPYYQYIAKKDISYTDDQIETLKENSKNKALVDYLTTFRKIKSLSFVRKKGMDSVKKKSVSEGKRQAEILRTRAEKRQLIRTFSSEAMKIQGNMRFRDSNYDRRFTPKRFKAALAGFKKMQVKDLHFKNLRDIGENFKGNVHMFESVREFEHLLCVALQRQVKISDADMIEIRAKIKAFKGVEYMMYDLQHEMLDDENSFLNEKTFAEFFERSKSKLKEYVTPYDDYDLPAPGMDMESYFKGILKLVKNEHKNRNKAISNAYGIMHIGKKTDKKTGEEKWTLGQIPWEEQKKRSDDYQKNAFMSDYLSDLETYTQNGYGTRVQSFEAVYGKKIVKEIPTVTARVLGRYILGMSDEEVKEIIDIQMFGTEKEKEELWMKIFKEGKSANLSEMASEKPEVMFRNIAYKGRMGGIFANFGGSTGQLKKYIKDKNIIDEAEAIYHAGTSHGQNYAAFAQAMKCKWFRSVPITEWFDSDVEKTNEFINEMNFSAGEDRLNRVIVDGKTISSGDNGLKELVTAFQRPYLMNTSMKSEFNAERNAKGCKNTARIALYEARKNKGIIKDITNEELKKFQSYYRENFNAVLKGENEKKVLLPEQTADEQAEALEKYFKEFISLDLSVFNFKSFSDMMRSGGKNGERFKKCLEITRMGRNVRDYLADYDKCRKKEAYCRLNDEHIKEISARCLTVSKAEVLFSDRFLAVLESPVIEKTGMSLDEIMHLTEPEILEMKKGAQDKKDAETENFWSLVLDLTANAQFDLNMELTDLMSAAREDLNCTGESRDKEIINTLSVEYGVLDDAVLDKIQLSVMTDEEFASQFPKEGTLKKLSVTEREGKMNNVKSRLYKKRIAAETLKEISTKVINDRVSARRNISLKSRMAAGEESLIHLSAFMTGIDKEDEALVKDYAAKETRFDVLDKLTKDLASFRADLEIVDDQSFAEKAEELETVSGKVTAWFALLEENPEYKDKLRFCSDPKEGCDLDILVSRFNEVLALSDYYRVRKMLITDPYFISHYNDELSLEINDRSTDDEHFIADLIRMVRECRRRIVQREMIDRSNEGMDDILQDMEEKSRRRAFLFGQVDLEKADISYTRKRDAEIRRYFTKVVESTKDKKDKKLYFSDMKKMVPEKEEEHPFPEQAKYETEAVKLHIATFRRFTNIVDNSKRYDTYDENDKKTHNKLVEAFRFSAFELNDPVTKEHFFIKTSPSRLINNIILAFGKDVPLEEILEMAEGFNVIKNNKLNVNDPEEFAYAKKRWMESARKLFYLEYNYVKRFESTYGTLPDQLPIGSFLHSLGNSKEYFFDRLQFIQESTEIADEAHCEVDGEKMSLGEYLVREGLVKEEELRDMLHLNAEFYQTVGSHFNDYYSKMVTHFEDDPQEAFTSEQDTLFKQTYSRKQYDFKGPKLSFDQERKYFKDALEQGDSTMYGGRVNQLFYKHQLKIYSSSELRDLKEERETSARIIHYYELIESERAETLTKIAAEKMGDEADLQLIDKFIYFHPAMMNDKAVSNKDTEEFITLIKDYVGIGVPEETKAERRSLAYKKMTDRMNAIKGPMLKANKLENDDPDDGLIESDTFEDQDNVNYGSRLLRTVVLEHLLDTTQSLMTEEKDKTLISKEAYKDFKEVQRLVVPNSIVKGMMVNKRYLALKDLGNKGTTVPDIEFMEIEHMLSNMGNASIEMDDPSFTDYQRKILRKLFGINVLKTSEILGINEEEKKAEVVKVKKKVKKTAEKKAEKNAEKNAGPVKVKKKTEVKEEKKAEAVKTEKKTEVKEEKKAEAVLGPLPNHKTRINMTLKDYEGQKRGSFNCWAVAGAALYNKLVGKKEIDQYDVRNFSLKDDEFKSFEEANKMGVGVTMEQYEIFKNHAKEFMGKGKNAFGSIYEAADFFIRRNRNIAIRRVAFKLPPLFRYLGDRQYVEKTDEEKERDRVLYHKQKEAFLNQVNSILQTGSPVAILNHSEVHFRTITGIDGENITVLDSYGPKEEVLKVDDLLKRENNFNTIELTWFSGLRKPEEEMAEQPNLDFSAEKGYSLRENTPENAHNPQWREGISVTTEDDELMIMRSAYIPLKESPLKAKK